MQVLTLTHHYILRFG